VPDIDFRYAPPDGWTVICRPDDPFKSIVREDGALLYGFDGRVVEVCRFDTVLELSAETAHPPIEIDQRTETPGRAIVVTTVRYPNQTLELVAFGHEEAGQRSDVVLWTITASDDADELLAALRVEQFMTGADLAGPPGDVPANELYRVAVDAPLAVPPEGEDGLRRLPEPLASQAAPALRSAPQTLMEVHARGFRPAAAFKTAPALLRAGQSTQGAIVVPLGGQRTAAMDLDWARKALERERRFWDTLNLTPRRIEVPDGDVQDLLIACSRNILQAREIEHEAPVPHVGATIYRGLWLVDGHFMLEAARYLGFDEAADAGLEALLRRVKPDGSISGIEHVPHIKETGIAIATLVRQAELSGHPERLRPRWPVIRAAVAHIEELRRAAPALPGGHRLMPDAFADGGIAGARPELTTALWTLVGLQHAARGAELLGEREDGEHFGAAYDALRRDFLASAEAQRARLPGGAGHYLPMSEPASGLHQFRVGHLDGDVPRWRAVQPESATWALCHAIWPGEVFDPDDKVVADLLALFDTRDDEQGIPATTGWLPYRAVWTYAASFAAHAWLYAGRPDKAIDYLYAFANHAFPTRVWREEQSLAGSGYRDAWGDMPHNWASAEFIRLVRHLLVFERGPDLELLAGLPDAWTLPGSRIHLDPSPTRFGEIGLTSEAREHDLTLHVQRVARGHPPPGAVRLVVPPRFRREVVVDDAAASPVDGKVELILRDETAVTVRARA
jgi:hypothetical protein